MYDNSSLQGPILVGDYRIQVTKCLVPMSRQYNAATSFCEYPILLAHAQLCIERTSDAQSAGEDDWSFLERL